MRHDIRESAPYREAEALYTALTRPGTGSIVDAADVTTDGRLAIYAATIVPTLDGVPPTRICSTDLLTGQSAVLTSGPNVDRSPALSPDGRTVAFLSDRGRRGEFQLFLLDLRSGHTHAAASADGSVEYLRWAPDGERILLGAVDSSLDAASAPDGVATASAHVIVPVWLPQVDAGEGDDPWRRLWVYDRTIDGVVPIGRRGVNVWEATWCGPRTIAAVVSDGPRDGLWYRARLEIFDLGTTSARAVHVPRDQLGCLDGSPSGRQLAFVEALCSDRGAVAGDLRILDTLSGRVRAADTHGIDVTYTQWISEQALLLAGHRHLETVVAVLDVDAGTLRQEWASSEITTSGRLPVVAGVDERAFVLVADRFLRPPELAIVRDGRYRTVRSFDVDVPDGIERASTADAMTWTAPDGLEIEGWLLRPRAVSPQAVVLNVHGGPVYQWRPTWTGRRPQILMLLRRGYAMFLPNPRGSSGRGQAFARRVVGDIGGADKDDCVSGLEYLVREGVVDPRRMGVTGVSYGGYMTAWLITQEPERFAAAVAVCPSTNRVTQRLLSNIPEFVRIFTGDDYADPSSLYFQRSPVMHARRARTPTLIVCGALDRATPPEEAAQFHSALRQNGGTSALVTYPREGHGIRSFPALIDNAARLVSWFDRYIPATTHGQVAAVQSTAGGSL